MKERKDMWQYVTDIAINVRAGKFDELTAAQQVMDECVKLLEKNGRKVRVAAVDELKEYPLLLSVSHVAEICSCHRSTAYEIMKEPHRPAWTNGKKVRLHRDLFFAQLKEELRGKVG